MRRRMFLQGLVGGVASLLAGKLLPWVGHMMPVGLGRGSLLIIDNRGMTIEFKSELTGGAWTPLPPPQSWSELGG